MSKTKLTAMLVALSLIFSLVAIPAQAEKDPRVWDGSVASEFAAGSGTRDDPYLIQTAAELALFRNIVNSTYPSICAKQVADIDLNNRDWKPIGMSATGFTGIYDGGGWAIENIRINQVSDVIKFNSPFNGKVQKIQVAGFFGVVGAGGRVRCVNISGKLSINKSYSYNTGIYIGAIAGENNGYIEECFTTCNFEDFSIKNNDYIGIGGIVGINKYLVMNCFNTGSMNMTVRGTKNSLNQYIGGIIGYDYGNTYLGGTYNCYSAAPISISTNLVDKYKYYGGCAGIVKSVTGFSNNFYDKQVCTTMPAIVGMYENNGNKSYKENPYGSNGLDTWMMKAEDFPAALSNAYSYDSRNLNNGYPILSVMTYHEQSDWSEWFDDEVGTSEADEEIYNKVYPAELLNKDLTKPITRVEFAAIAVKLYEELGGEKLVASNLWMPFTDTNSDVVMKAYNIGIIKGISDTEFDPYSNISRQDLATMLTRVYKRLYLNGWTLDQDAAYVLDYNQNYVFEDDADISDYAKASVYFMVDNNVIKGISATKFGPRNVTTTQQAENYANATREQALIMAVRSFKNFCK